ncbi:MAG: ABC transporter permease [Gammaproteobacteria bacterium]|nr:ABC transporter permease [Gammaproteobacteria bacterium]
MLTHLKITLRNLRREKFYVAINVLGLAVAMVCALLIGMHVRSELTYDQHIPQHKKLYRASITLINSDGETEFSQMSQFMAPALAAQHPAIEDFVRFRGPASGEALINIRGEPSYWDKVYEADDNVFEVFGHAAVHGDMSSALVDPGAAAISNRFNQIHFDGADSVGETITVNGRDYRVALVYEDQPANTHFKYDVLLSINGLAYPEPDALPMSLFMVNTYTYFVMPENYDAARFSGFFDEYWEGTTGALTRSLGLDNDATMQLTPIADVHYGPALEFDQPVGNLLIVYAYAVVGALILLVACINYVNLATARSARRLKEVAMRKVLGVERGALIAQFLLESFCIALLAGILALTAVEVLVQSGVAGQFSSALEPGLYRDPVMLGMFLLVSTGIGLLSGLYPAFYLSSHFVMPGSVKRQTSATESVMRQTLVVFQFAVTVSVIACSLLILGQMRYIQNAPLGFEKDDRVVLSIKGVDFIERTPELTARLSQMVEVAGVTLTALAPGVDSYSGNWSVESNDGAMESRFINFQNVDSRYLDVMGMELTAGRFFTEGDGRNLVVVNEALVRNMGWENPLGKRTGMPAQEGEIVGGVVRDFHFSGLQTAIAPLIIRQTNPGFYGAVTNPAARQQQAAQLTIALVDGANPETMDHIQTLWRETMPGLPFAYQFLEDIIRQQYDSENRILDVIAWFAAVCVVISCLGLLGLSAWSTERRTREIGIRKVFGAGAAQIMLTLFRNIFVLVSIGSIVASVLTWYVINGWLQNFAYRDEINLLVFPAAAALAIGSAFLTMALQSWRTINRNPVHALRYE